MEESRATMQRSGMELFQERKAEVLREARGVVEKRDLQSRDLLTLLIKANMATDIPDSQRLSDEDVLARTYCYMHIIAGSARSLIPRCLGTEQRSPRTSSPTSCTRSSAPD